MHELFYDFYVDMTPISLHIPIHWMVLQRCPLFFITVHVFLKTLVFSLSSHFSLGSFIMFNYGIIFFFLVIFTDIHLYNLPPILLLASWLCVCGGQRVFFNSLNCPGVWVWRCFSLLSFDFLLSTWTHVASFTM